MAQLKPLVQTLQAHGLLAPEPSQPLFPKVASSLPVWPATNNGAAAFQTNGAATNQTGVSGGAPAAGSSLDRSALARPLSSALSNLSTGLPKMQTGALWPFGKAGQAAALDASGKAFLGEAMAELQQQQPVQNGPGK